MPTTNLGIEYIGGNLRQPEVPINAAFDVIDTAFGTDAWTAPTFQNSWTNYGSGRAGAGYRLRNGRVELNGVIAGGSAMNTTAFILPVGYRPAFTKDIPCDSNNAYGKVLIGTDGTVKPYTGTTAHFSLDGVAFDPA